MNKLTLNFPELDDSLLDSGSFFQRKAREMKQAKRVKLIWIIKHSWPNQHGEYTVMPNCFSSEGAAAFAALKYLGNETKPGHKYEVTSLELES
jgi:hypothetical protein